MPTCENRLEVNLQGLVLGASISSNPMFRISDAPIDFPTQTENITLNPRLLDP